MQGSHAANTIGQKETTVKYSSVFDKTSTQKHIFDTTVAPTIQRALTHGTSGLVFAYGMTNAGKTYTISGKGSLDSEGAGILPRSLSTLLKHVEAYNVAHPGSTQLVLSVTYVEVYNENTYDLLRGAEGSSASGSTAAGANTYSAAFKPGPAAGAGTKAAGQGGRVPLEITTVGPAHVKGAKQWLVLGKRAAERVLQYGAENKTHAATALNSDSSRSHTVFSISVLKRDSAVAGTLPPGYAVEEPAEVAVLSETRPFYASGYTPFSRLTVVDLAGSESQKRTGATGQALKEAGNINKSLMFLQQCLRDLRQAAETGAQQPKAAGSFRNSKLTFLLRDSLQGANGSSSSVAGDIIMIVCACPGAKDYDETKKAIEFGALMKETRVVRAKNLSTWTRNDGVDANGRRLGKDGKPIVRQPALAKTGATALARADSAGSGLTATSSFSGTAGSLALGGLALGSTQGTTTSGAGGLEGTMSLTATSSFASLGVGAGFKRARGSEEADGEVSDVSALTAELDTARAQLEQLSAEHKAGEAAMVDMQSKLAAVTATYQGQVGELEAQVMELAAYREGMEGEVQELRSAAFEVGEERDALNREVNRLAAELEEKEEQLEAQEEEIRNAMAEELEKRLQEAESLWKARLEKAHADMAAKLSKLLALQDNGAGKKGKGSKAGSSARASLAALMAQVGLTVPSAASTPGSNAAGGAASRPASAHVEDEGDEDVDDMEEEKEVVPRVGRAGARSRSTLGSVSEGGRDSVHTAYGAGSSAGGGTEEAVEAMRATIAQLTENLHEVDDELRRTQQKLSASEKLCSEAQSLAGRLGEQVAVLQEQVVGLGAELDEASAAAASAAEATVDARSDAETAQQQLAEAQAQLAQLESTLAGARAELAQAQRDKSTAEARAESAEAALADNNATVDGYRNKIEGLNARVKTLTDQLKPAVDRAAAAEAAAVQAKAEAHMARGEAAALRSEGAVPMVPSELLQAAQATIGELQGRVTALQADIQALRSGMVHTYAQMTSVKQEAENRAKKDGAWINKYEQEASAKDARIQALEAQLASAQAAAASAAASSVAPAHPVASAASVPIARLPAPAADEDPDTEPEDHDMAEEVELPPVPVAAATASRGGRGSGAAARGAGSKRGRSSSRRAGSAGARARTSAAAPLRTSNASDGIQLVEEADMYDLDATANDELLARIAQDAYDNGFASPELSVTAGPAAAAGARNNKRQKTAAAAEAVAAPAVSSFDSFMSASAVPAASVGAAQAGRPKRNVAPVERFAPDAAIKADAERAKVAKGKGSKVPGASPPAAAAYPTRATSAPRGAPAAGPLASPTPSGLKPGVTPGKSAPRIAFGKRIDAPGTAAVPSFAPAPAPPAAAATAAVPAGGRKRGAAAVSKPKALLLAEEEEDGEDHDAVDETGADENAAADVLPKAAAGLGLAPASANIKGPAAGTKTASVAQTGAVKATKAVKAARRTVAK